MGAFCHNYLVLILLLKLIYCGLLIYVQKGDIEHGVEALAIERQHWLSRPELLIRAARHYEGAAQILIRHAVMSAKQVR